MIHLCYTKKRLHNSDYFDFRDSLFQSLKETDLVLFPANIRTDKKSWKGPILCNWVSDESIDLEKIAGQNITNIIAMEWEQIDQYILRKIIALKSIKCEIIGVANTLVQSFTNSLMEIEHYKETGFSNDELSVMLILKDNRSPKFVSTCMERVDKYKNSRFRFIESVDDIKKLLKY